jgi:hypothetical protein
MAAGFRNIKPSHLTTIRKKYGLSPGDPLSASQFRELQQMANSTSAHGPVFAFRYKIEFIYEDKGALSELRVTLYGNHISKNRFDALPMRYRYRYIRAIKEAARIAGLQYSKELNALRERGVLPFDKASVRYRFFVTHSRDHDNGSETIKRLQDTFTRLGLIVDDKRRHLRMEGEPEEYLVGKEERRVEAILRVEGEEFRA